MESNEGSSEGPSEEKPRRRFLKWAGSFAVIGGVGITLGSMMKNPRVKEETVTDTATQTSTTTATATTTATSVQTDLSTETQTSTETVVVDSTTTTTTTETLGVQPTSIANSEVSTAIAPAPGSFSIFWITDTQFLSESNPAVYKMMNRWIVRNWVKYNGKLVIHTGDMVQTGDIQQEWVNANDAHKIFTDNGIPYTWCAGNHDDWVLDDESSGWIGNVWGAPAFDPVAQAAITNSYSYTKWVGDFHAGMDMAMTFTANGMNFLVIMLEWNADSTVLQWAQSIIDNPQYADYWVIFGPHAYIDAYGDDDDLRWGPTLANFVGGLVPMLNSHPNVFLTLNGHFATDTGFNSPLPVNGTRNELMFDRQDAMDNPTDPTGRGEDNVDNTTPDTVKVGGATVTILNFDTVNNQIHVTTFDPYLGQWRIDAGNQYTLTMFPPGASLPSSGVAQEGKPGARIRVPARKSLGTSSSTG